MICIVGPSATGKTTVAKLIADMPQFHRIITYTTRSPREGERNGVDYHFVSQDAFDLMKLKNEFAEYAEYNGWHYGTAKKDCLDNGIIVVTPKGLRNLKKNTDLKITSFYFRVPRRDCLIKSLETRENIDECIARSLRDIGQFDGVEEEVDYVIDNPGYQKPPEIIVSEILRLLS